MNEIEVKNDSDVTLDDGNKYVKQAKAILIRTNNDHALAGAYLDVINKEIKIRKEYFKPRKQKAKEVHQAWVKAEKESIKPFEEAKKIINTKMTAYLNMKQKEIDKKLEATKKEAEEKGINPELVSISDSLPEGHKRVTYKFKVENFSAVPDEYKLIDERALGELARKTKGEAKVEGIRFYKSYITV